MLFHGCSPPVAWARLPEIIAQRLEAHVSRSDLTDQQRANGAEELLAVIRRYSK